MSAVDGGAAKLEDAGAQRLVGAELELLRGVVAEIARGGCARLHAISADDAARLILFDDKVLAHGIEPIDIETGFIRAFKTFAELDVKDAEAQAAGGLAIFAGARGAQGIRACFSANFRLDQNGIDG